MPFDALLGNQRLKENLITSLAQGHISHFYVISGPAGSGKHTLARLLSAAILCKDAKAPCLRCNPCRKVMEGNHPDLITVDDPDHKNVAVKIVRQARDDVYIRPNESDHKIYLFPQELGIEGQNALLKILEEPPSYGVFLLLTDNPERLLPTIRSRCTELSLQALPESLLTAELSRQFPEASQVAIAAAISRSGGYLGQARLLLEQGSSLPAQTEQFLDSLISKSPLLLAQTLAPMEKWRRDQLIPILESWVALLEEAVACRNGMRCAHPKLSQLAAGRSSRDLMLCISHLQQSITYAQSNVSPAAICGYLVWQLR